MIPKVMHRIWVGGEMPTQFVEYGKTWQRLHPGWRQLLWTDSRQVSVEGVEQCTPVLRFNSEFYEAAERYAPRNVGQLRADLLRYELMWEFGGVYVDADFECFKSIEPLLEGVDCFAIWESEGVWAANGLMGSTPQHEFVRELIAQVPSSIRSHLGKRPNAMTGPQLLTRVFKQRHAAGRSIPVLFPKRYFLPYLWNELHRRGEVFPEAYAVHHWHNRRRERGIA